MPRFVLLRHECPPDFGKPSHWDLMLEWGDVLRTWELRELPSRWAAALHSEAVDHVVKAIALPDHRLAYLDFEGPLSGNRGLVRRCDSGNYDLLCDQQNRVEARLHGDLICGVMQLECLETHWRLTAADA